MHEVARILTLGMNRERTKLILGTMHYERQAGRLAESISALLGLSRSADVHVGLVGWLPDLFVIAGSLQRVAENVCDDRWL